MAEHRVITVFEEALRTCWGYRAHSAGSGIRRGEDPRGRSRGETERRAGEFIRPFGRQDGKPAVGPKCGDEETPSDGDQMKSNRRPGRARLLDMKRSPADLTGDDGAFRRNKTQDRRAR